MQAKASFGMDEVLYFTKKSVNKNKTAYQFVTGNWKRCMNNLSEFSDEIMNTLK